MSQKGERFDFTRGISSVVDPRFLGEGFSVAVDNIDLTAFVAQSMRAPVFRMDPPAGTKDIYEYRGKWHYTPGRREWLADFVGRQERLYYKDIEPGASDRRLYMVIDGVTALLGTPKPPVPPLVKEAGYLSPKHVEATVLAEGGKLPAGSITYRVGLRTELGLIPASAPVTVVVTEKSRVNLTFDKVTYDKALKIVIYGRKSNEEQILEELNPTVTEWTDDGSLTPSGQYAKTLDESTVFHYFHTFVRDVNGYEDESGPSPIYGPLVTPQARVITRNVFFEGLFDGGYTWAPGEMTVAASPSNADIVGAFIRTDFNTYVTTRTAHARPAGTKVGIMHAHGGTDANLRNQIYHILNPTAALPKPAITALEETDLPEGATAWPASTSLQVGVVAFRGASWDHCFGGSPAETDLVSGDLQTISTTGDKAAVVRWSYPAGGADGFHVYLNGFYIATVDKGVLFYTFGQVTPNATRPSPTVNTSASRIMILGSEAKDIAWDEVYAAANSTLGSISYDPRALVTMTQAHGYVPAKGDLVYFTPSIPNVGGFTEVQDEATSSTFYIPLLNDAAASIQIGQEARIAGPQARFIKSWNLYVMRGDTGDFLLQGNYPLTQSEVIDASPVEALGSTCGSFYTEVGDFGNPVIVSFEPPPPDLHGLTLHQSMLWGIVDRTVRWTPINRPNAWPDAYQRDFEYQPLALASYAGTLLVLCTDGIYRMDGADPNSIRRNKTLAEDGLIAPFSVQPTPAGLVYLSKRGLMAFRGETNGAVPISEGKVEPALFLAGSGAREDDPFPFWAIPTRKGAAWARLTKRLPAANPDRSERELSDVLPMDWSVDCIRSFVWKGKYHLYYGDPSGKGAPYKYHGMVIVDCTREGYPITTNGLKPVAAHVTEMERAFLLFQDPTEEGEPG